MPSKILKRSKKKKNATPCEKWKDNEMVVLLAWADHNLELDPTSGWQRFCESIETHLREACGILKTQAQIQRKLNQVWGAYGRHEVYEYPNLIKVEGSKCLENPDFVWHEAIDKRKKVLAHENFIEQLSKRNTRSVSKAGNRRMGSCRSAVRFDLETSPLLRNKRRNISGSRPYARNVRKNRVLDAAEVAADELLKQERLDTPANTPQRQSIIQDSFSECALDLERESENEHDDSIMSGPNQESLVVSLKSSRKIKSASSSSNLQSHCRPGTVDASTQTSPVSEARQASDYSQERFRLQQEKYESRIAFDSARMKDKENEAKRYEQQLNALRYALQAKDRGNDLIKQLASSRTKVKTLENTLADRRLLQPFSRLASNEPVLCDYGFVGTKMDLIGRDINSLARLDGSQAFDFSAFAETPETAQLVLRAFPGFDTSGGSTCLTDKAPIELKLNDFIRTLVGAALCCWVFEFPLKFLHTNSPCGLCSQYRTCLEIQDGAAALRNLDFAAHTRLLDEAVFQGDGVRAEAKRLTTKLCDVLRPMFVQQEQMGIVPQSSLYKHSESGLNDIERLQTIFETALMVKAKLVLSTNVFEAVMYTPGTPFSKAKMTLPKSSLRIPAEITHSRQRLEIVCCYLPALVEHQVGNTLVDNNNFVRSVPADGTRLKPFTKALVLL